MSQAVMVALYARVSSDQQAKRGTIESQIAALMERRLMAPKSLRTCALSTPASAARR